MSSHEHTVSLAVIGTLGGISFCLTVVSLYWLVRSKRNFRHDLILLLIITDVVKSIAYLALPIAAWGRVNVGSQSRYCQFSGFIMALTVEATDYLILVLTLQTVFHVFQQHRYPKFGSLSDHRYVIYALWLSIPALMASLAFINPKGGYISVGSFCYLPKDPIWYRLTLAWIPRCFVFFFILISHSAIYFYTVQTFKENRKTELHFCTQENIFNENQSTGNNNANLEHGNDHARVTPETLEACEFRPYLVIEKHPHSGKWLSIGSTDPTTMTSANGEASGEVSNLQKKRLEIQRQLRILFIYPLIYLLMWIFPLVGQVIQYSSGYQAGKMPFWISLVWGMFLASQAGVDALLFLSRERPWNKKRSSLPT